MGTVPGNSIDTEAETSDSIALQALSRKKRHDPGLAGGPHTTSCFSTEPIGDYLSLDEPRMRLTWDDLLPMSSLQGDHLRGMTSFPREGSVEHIYQSKSRNDRYSAISEIL